MITDYTHATRDFITIIDFLRFGLSQANAHKVYFGHGTDNAWDDIFALITATLNLPLNVDYALLQARLTIAEKEKICHQLEQRILQRIPVPYLTQTAYFCGYPFYVDRRVLIPRSPLAELIEAQFAPWIAPLQVKRILDLCTGSGCIAIACCHAFPQALVDAVDISPSALEVAVLNRAQHELNEVLSLFASDCFAALPPSHYDIIVSNPPYVGGNEMDTLPPEYHHEPRMALEAPNNGLAIVEKILYQAPYYLSKQGILVVEVGNSEALLIERFPTVPFTWLEFAHGGQGVFLLTYQQLVEHFSG